MQLLTKRARINATRQHVGCAADGARGALMPNHVFHPANGHGFNVYVKVPDTLHQIHMTGNSGSQRDSYCSTQTTLKL